MPREEGGRSVPSAVSARTHEGTNRTSFFPGEADPVEGVGNGHAGSVATTARGCGRYLPFCLHGSQAGFDTIPAIPCQSRRRDPVKMRWQQGPIGKNGSPVSCVLQRMTREIVALSGHERGLTRGVNPLRSHLGRGDRQLTSGSPSPVRGAIGCPRHPPPRSGSCCVPA